MQMRLFPPSFDYLNFYLHGVCCQALSSAALKYLMWYISVGPRYVLQDIVGYI